MQLLAGFGVFGIVAMIFICYVYARGPSFKHGAFKDQVRRHKIEEMDGERMNGQESARDAGERD